MSKRGKLVRQGRGGIDWYRYSKLILRKKLLPFAKECQKDRLGTIVQEDGATPHISPHNLALFREFGLERLDWPGNSPDLNAIKPCWPWMKRWTTREGPLQHQVKAEEKWLKCWDELPQSEIQCWITWIPHAIQVIIKLDRGNEYKETSRYQRAAQTHARPQVSLSSQQLARRRLQLGAG